MQKQLAPAIASGLIAAIVLYFGAYFSLVQRGYGLFGEAFPLYRIGDGIGTETQRSILAPAHYVDRHLRPSYWQTNESVRRGDWSPSED